MSDIERQIAYWERLTSDATVLSRELVQRLRGRVMLARNELFRREIDGVLERGLLAVGCRRCGEFDCVCHPNREDMK